MERCLRFKELRALIGNVARATVDRWEKDPKYYNGFPKRVVLGPCSVCWLAHEVQDWLKARSRR